MSQTNHLTEAELRQRLAEVEAILAALRSSKADTLIGNNGPLLFQPKSAVEERERQQRQAERIAREWATTFDAVQEAIWILDLDQRVVRANAAAEKAFGCPLAEMIARRCFEIAHHTDRPISGCPFCSMRVSRQRESFEMRVGERWFNVTTDPLLDERDNLIGAVHIARDITDQKQAEERIRESEETYHNLFQNAQVGLFRTRISDGKILESNEQLARMFGYDSREEFIAEFVTTSSYVDPGTRERMLREIRENGTIKNFEARFYRKDGSTFWARYSARIYPDKGWIEGVAENITEQKQAQEALQAALNRSQRQQDAVATLAVSPAIVAGDLPGAVEQITELAARVMGVERVGVWLFDEQEDKLRCVDLYESSLNRHSAGAVLCRHEYHCEFEALLTARYVDADDPLTDPRTAGYVEGYLKPLGITSMLDAVIRNQGRNFGVICFEHVNQPHHWEPDEIAFACQISDQIALLLINRERKRAEEELRRHAEELRIRNEALTRFNAVAVGRELRMIELKREVNELCLKIGEPPRYKIVTVPQTSDTPPEGRK